MFLHIGGNYVIPVKNIIAIMDLETTSLSKDTKEFLKVAEEEGFVKGVTDEIPKSYIITEFNKKSEIYLSAISSATLQKRVNSLGSVKNYLDKWK